MNPYDVLGVTQGATPTEVHAAWRRLAEVYAPARHTDAPPEVQAEAARRLAEVNAAYLATQEELAQASPTTSPLGASVGGNARRGVASIVGGVVLVAILGVPALKAAFDHTPQPAATVPLTLPTAPLSAFTAPDTLPLPMPLYTTPAYTFPPPTTSSFAHDECMKFATEQYVHDYVQNGFGSFTPMCP